MHSRLAVGSLSRIGRLCEVIRASCKKLLVAELTVLRDLIDKWEFLSCELLEIISISNINLLDSTWTPCIGSIGLIFEKQILLALWNSTTPSASSSKLSKQQPVVIVITRRFTFLLMLVIAVPYTSQCARISLGAEAISFHRQGLLWVTDDFHSGRLPYPILQSFQIALQNEGSLWNTVSYLITYR